jgi:hypothetical protein
MFSVNVHQMRIEAHARDGSIWLDLLPRGQSGMLPRLTVFIEAEDVFALRRELDEIAGLLAPVDGNIEHAPAERLPA